MFPRDSSCTLKIEHTVLRVRKPYSSGIGSGAGTTACERGNIGQAVRAANVISCNPEWLLERLDLYGEQ